MCILHPERKIKSRVVFHEICKQNEINTTISTNKNVYEVCLKGRACWQTIVAKVSDENSCVKISGTQRTVSKESWCLLFL